ncbi:MAG: type IV secretory system conjugative DNA transfer family protein [Flavisolibacter sp.]
MTDSLPPIKPIIHHYKIGTSVQRIKNAAGVVPPTTLGRDTRTNQQVTIDDNSRFSGCYIIGKQGVGKSTLVEQMICQDIEKGYGVIVLDPHGQLIDNVIARMSGKHIGRAYLLDITDLAYPFGFNIFSCKDVANDHQRSITNDRVMSIFERVWPSEGSGLLLPMLLQAVTETLIEHADTMTMNDIPALLLDADYRSQKVASLRDKGVRDYWEMEYNVNSPSVQRRETAPLRVRLNKWLRKPVMRGIICQKQATIDIRASIDRHEILFIKLPVKLEGFEHAAPDIGTMLLSQIKAATLSYMDTPEHFRPGFSLYIDEFQNFISRDTATLFTEGRKFRVRQILAHQTRTQLTMKEVLSATMTAKTVVAFSTEPSDSSDLARLFTDYNLYPEIGHIYRDILPRLKSHKNKAVTDFWARYVRRWDEAQGKSVKTRREDGYEIKTWPEWNLGFGLVEYHPNDIRAVLSLLEELLYEAMLTKEQSEERTELLLIRVEHWFTSSQVEQFSGHLNKAIAALISEPIGEQRETNKEDLVNFLTDLENFHALIRIRGTPSVVIQTLPPSPSVSTTELHKRLARIKDQTRKKYCRPREDIERELGELPASDTDIETDSEVELDNLQPQTGDTDKGQNIKRPSHQPKKQREKSAQADEPPLWKESRKRKPRRSIAGGEDGEDE